MYASCSELRSQAIGQFNITPASHPGYCSIIIGWTSHSCRKFKLRKLKNLQAVNTFSSFEYSNIQQIFVLFEPHKFSFVKKCFVCFVIFVCRTPLTVLQPVSQPSILTIILETTAIIHSSTILSTHSLYHTAHSTHQCSLSAGWSYSPNGWENYFVRLGKLVPIRSGATQASDYTVGRQQIIILNLSLSIGCQSLLSTTIF